MEKTEKAVKIYFDNHSLHFNGEDADKVETALLSIQKEGNSKIIQLRKRKTNWNNEIIYTFNIDKIIYWAKGEETSF